MKKLTGAACLLLFGLAACDSTAPDELGTPTELEKVSGDRQSAAPGSALSRPFVVMAKGQGNGELRSGRVVEWAIVSGSGGQLSASQTTTDSAGLATVTATLPQEAGSTLQVRASPSQSEDSVRFTATAAQTSSDTSTSSPSSSGAASIDKLSGGGQKAMKGDTLASSLRAQVTDSTGAAVSGATVTWSIVTDNGGSLRFRTTTSDDQGVVENTWRVGDGANTVDSVRARIDGRDTVSYAARVTGTPDRIRVLQGAIELDNNATAAPDSAVGDTVTVAPGYWSRDPFKAVVVDTAGVSVPGAQLSWTVTSGGGTVGDEPDGSGEETVTVNTALDGSVTVWRRASSDTTKNAAPGEWAGATLSLENFPGVEPVTLDALIAP